MGDRTLQSFDDGGRQGAAGVIRKTGAWVITGIAIAMELIDRGPAALTIEGVESYRTKVMKLLEHIRPVVASEARLTLANWTNQLLAA